MIGISGRVKGQPWDSHLLDLGEQQVGDKVRNSQMGIQVRRAQEKSGLRSRGLEASREAPPAQIEH